MTRSILGQTLRQTKVTHKKHYDYHKKNLRQNLRRKTYDFIKITQNNLNNLIQTNEHFKNVQYEYFVMRLLISQLNTEAMNKSKS